LDTVATLRDDSSAETPEPSQNEHGQPAAGSANTSSLNEYQTLYRRASHFLGGTIALFILGFISFPILARILTVEQYGLLALVSNTVAVAVVFSKCGLQTSVQRFYKEHAVSAPGTLQTYYSTVYLTAAVLGLMVTLPFVLLLAFRYLPKSVISNQVQLLLGYAAALIFLRSITSMITNLLQVEGRTTAYNVLQVLTKAAATATTVLLLLTWRREPSAFFVGCVLVEGAAVLLMVPYLRRRNMLALRGFDSRVCREALAFGFPMMITEIFWLVLDSGDRFLVEGYLGPQQLGLYAAAYNISGYIRDSLSSPLYLALFPLVMELWVLKGRDETRNFLSRSMNYFVLAGIGVIVAVSVCSKDAINIIASSKFHDAHRLLPYLVTGMMISAMSMFLKSSLMLYKRTGLLMKISLVSCLVNVAMNVVLLPKIGLLGAALATLGSYAVMTAMFAYYAQDCLPISMDWAAWLKYAAIGVFSWFVVSPLEFKNFFASLFVRGTLSLLVYFGIVFALDARGRELGQVLTKAVSRSVRGQRPAGEGSAA
jgi:O-antigen/teichoic acid export membrane protein